jgi:hypothetical protein
MAAKRRANTCSSGKSANAERCTVHGGVSKGLKYCAASLHNQKTAKYIVRQETFKAKREITYCEMKELLLSWLIQQSFLHCLQSMNNKLTRLCEQAVETYFKALS